MAQFKSKVPHHYKICKLLSDKISFVTKDYEFQQVYIKIFFNASFQENLINQLYQGEMKDYVKCLKVSYYALSVMIRPLTGRIFTYFWTLKNGE